jgi:hypothetical protein
LKYFARDIIHDDWTPAEDLMLIEKHREFGNQWSQIKQFIPGRQAVTIKNRWDWLCRRNIPNRSIEFRGLVRAHQTNEGVSGEDVAMIWGSNDGQHGNQIEFGGDANVASFGPTF